MALKGKTALAFRQQAANCQRLGSPFTAGLCRRLAAAGAAATPDTPLAWLRLEPDGVRGSAAIQPTLWPGGETRALGRGDYHGRFADWHDP